MLVKFFKRGIGNTRHGKSVQNYLLSEERVKNNTAVVLRGDPELTTAIIDTLDFAKTYTSGCLSFTEREYIDDSQKEAIMDSFERTLLPSLDADQYQCYWVQHTDKGRLEMNFVVANVELLRGTAMTVYNHRTDKALVDTWKDLTNLVYGLDNPNDPINRRNYRASNLNGSQERHTKAMTKKDVAMEIGEIIEEGIYDYRINNREDVIRTIQQHGYRVVDDSNPLYLKIANPDQSLYRGKPRRPIKLVGDYFRADLDADNTIPNARAEQSRDYQRQQRQNIEKLKSRYEELSIQRKDRLQMRYKRSCSDNLTYDARYLLEGDKNASMSLFEALNLSATGRYAYPNNFYTPITRNYAEFMERYQLDTPGNQPPIIAPDDDNPETSAALRQLCKNINKRLEADPSYFKSLFTKNCEDVLSENRAGLDQDQFLQLRKLAGINLITRKLESPGLTDGIKRYTYENGYHGSSM